LSFILNTNCRDQAAVFSSSSSWSGHYSANDTDLSSKNLEGFDKVNDTTYQTSNYDSSSKKKNLELKLGVSSLRVKRQ